MFAIAPHPFIFDHPCGCVLDQLDGVLFRSKHLVSSGRSGKKSDSGHPAHVASSPYWDGQLPYEPSTFGP